MAIRWSVGRTGAEVLLASALAAAWFALCAVALSELLPHLLVVGLGMALLSVVVVFAIARWWGIAYAVPVGVASVVAVDWHYIPPTHPSLVPDAQNLVALVAYLGTGVLLGQLDVAVRRRADVSEQARSVLADE